MCLVVNTTSFGNVTVVMVQGVDPALVLSLTILGILLTVFAFISRWAISGFIAGVVCLLSSLTMPYAMWSDGSTLTLYLLSILLNRFSLRG